MKKILLVSASVKNPGHGVVYLTELYKGLNKNVDVFIPLDAKINPLDFKPNTVFTTSLVNITDAKELNKKYKKFAPLVRGFNRISYGINFFKALIKHLKTSQYDIIHILDSEYIAYIYLLKKLNKSQKQNIVYTLHASDFDFQSFSFAGIYKYIVKGFLKKSLKQTKHVVCHGEWIKDRLVNSFGSLKNKITALNYPSKAYTSYDKAEAKKQIGLPENKTIISFLGMVRKDKKIETAFQAIKNLDSSFHLLVAGRLSDYTIEAIKELININNIEDKTTLELRYLTDEEYSNCFKATDIFLSTHSDKFPSASGPVSDARTYGLPVVVPPNGQLEKYVNDNNVGVVSKTYNPVDFANACQQIITNKKEYTNTVINASKLYSWSAFASNHSTIYNSIND